jgi:hypothetical protein
MGFNDTFRSSGKEPFEHFQKAIDLDPWREPVYVQFAELLEKMQVPGAHTRRIFQASRNQPHACEGLRVACRTGCRGKR